MASHGILNPNAGAAHFTLDRIEPAHDFAALVERYWLIRWSLRGDETFAQETLPHPCVNVVIGTHRPGVHGIGTKRFIAELSKTGWVFGIKFRPGAFRVVYERDASELTGREKSIASVFGDAGASVEGSVLERGGGPTCVELVEPLLRRFVPIRDENVALAARAVDLARAEPSIGRARDLAERVGVSPRSLERLFGKYVGVPPKWIIRRYRVHEACERVRSGAPASWPDLAQELGYFDQAHFIRDFKSQVGRTPAQYAAMCSVGRGTNGEKLPAERAHDRRDDDRHDVRRDHV